MTDRPTDFVCQPGRSDAQHIIAIIQVARGGPNKDYAAKLHACGAITYGPPLSGLCSQLDRLDRQHRK